MSLLIVLYLVLVIALPVALSAVVSYRSLPEGINCPLCGGDTIRLVARWLDAVAWAVRRSSLHRRWCPGCRWEGVCRVPREDGARTDADVLEWPVQLPDGGVRHDSMPSRRGAADAIDLRRLEVDGHAWRVLLQCWCDGARWHGRLLFVGSKGRLCTDGTETFTGATPLDVLGQALALPDRTLACRLRDALAD